MYEGRLRYMLSQSAIFQSARDLVSRFSNRDSYAQDGEDRFLVNTVFAGRAAGMYLDIGASHPSRISNTWLLYKLGWSGVTVEPIERLSKLHRAWRPRDTQVQALIGEADGSMTF